LARASPTWGWTWTPSGPTLGLQRQSSLLPGPKCHEFAQVPYGVWAAIANRAA